MSDAFRRYDPKWVIRGTAYSGFIAFIMQAIGMWILISFFYANSKHGGFETGYTNFVWKMEGGYRSVFISALLNAITGFLSSFLFAFFDSNAISHVDLTNLECEVIHRFALYLWLIARYTVYLFLIFRMEVSFRNTRIVALNVKLWVTIATIGFICYILILTVLGGKIVSAKHPRSSFLLKCNSLGASEGKEAVIPILAVIDFLITVVFVVYFSWTLWKLNNVMKSLEEPSVGSHNSKDLVRARTASGGNENENNGSPQISNAGSQEAAEDAKQENFLLKLARRSLIFGLLAVGSTLTLFLITIAGYGSPFVSLDAMINAYCILGAYGVPLDWLKQPAFWICGKLNNKSEEYSSGTSRDGKKSEDAEQLETIISTSSTS